MIEPPARLMALVDGDEVDLTALTDALRPHAPFDLADLALLSNRLPSGLVHADALWFVSEAPSGLEPLAPGSAWYAVDRTLVVVVPRGTTGLLRLLTDVGCYARWSWDVHERLDGQDALTEALLAPDLPSDQASTQLAMLLDASESLLRMTEKTAPGFRFDLGWMARRVFLPQLKLHASVRPGYGEARGRALATRLLAMMPSGPLRMVVSDSPLVAEHLSPYTRDLGHALNVWGVENNAALTTDGLAEALLASTGEPDADLCALVAADLFAEHPELLEERRTAEKIAGFVVEDVATTMVGWADVSRLDDPDSLAIPAGARGTLAIVAGGDHGTLAAAAQALIQTGRVRGAALVFGVGAAPSPVTIVDAVLSADDGFSLPWGGELADLAQNLGYECARVPSVEIDATNGVPDVLQTILRALRRLEATTGGRRRVGPRVALYARQRVGVIAPLETRLGPLLAARLVIHAVLQSTTSDTPRRDDVDKPSKSLRFRV